MADDRPTLFADFPPVSAEDWRRRVEGELGAVPFEEALVAQTLEGLAIQPLYTAADAVEDSGFPGLPPYRRGRRAAGEAWRIAARYGAGDPLAAREALQADLERGVGLLWIGLDRAGRAGLDPDEAADGLVGADGLALFSADGLGELLADVDLERVLLFLDAGGNGLPAAALLAAALAKRQGALETLRGSFCCDPLGALARDGRLATSLDATWAQLATLGRWCRDEAPGMGAALVSTAPYHEAGATAVEELALALATGLTYLQCLVEDGLTLSAAAGQIAFSYDVGQDLFLEIAKLRAARLLWAKVVGACGGEGEALATHLHARTAWRTKTVVDPWVNLLRGTTESFAAAVGGADSVETLPLDTTLGVPNVHGRRLALNTQLILAQEAHLDRVADPAGGSWYVEALTDALARAAWTRFQEIEGRGGMMASLLDGHVAAGLAATTAARRTALAHRRRRVVGVNTFPSLDEKRPQRQPADLETLRQEACEVLAAQRATHDAAESLASLAESGDDETLTAAIAAARAGASLGALSQALGKGAPATMTPLPSQRIAEAFERMRLACDRWKKREGRRPQVYIANLGSPAEFRDRSRFAIDFFAAAGIGPIVAGDPEDSATRLPAEIAVICSTDESYRYSLRTLVPVLRGRGVARIFLAGRPGEHEAAYRAAGIKGFVYEGCDAEAFLGEILSWLGVLR